MDNVELPSFWAEKPALWFAQVEAVFGLKRVTSDSDMYDHIVSELSNDVISLVEDIILNPPDIETLYRYDYLKQEVIERMCIKQLNSEEIGSMTPSEFLEHLQTKAYSSVSEETVKEIWVRRLPSHVKEVIKGTDCNNLELLTKIADKVFAVHLVEKPSNRSSIELEKKIDKLLEQMENLYKQVIDIQLTIKEKVGVCQNCKSKMPEVNLKSNDHKVSQMCWYHDKFGYRAVKCISPCRYKEQNVTLKL